MTPSPLRRPLEHSQPPLPRIPGSVFEGLFVRGLKVSGRLAQELEALGYDIRKPEVDYPIQLWQRAVALVRQEVFGELTDEEAHRQVGRTLVDGFAETLLGRVAAVALPMIGPARAAERIPRYLAMMGRPDLEVTMTPVGERGRRLVIPDRFNRPELFAGGFERMLEMANAQPRITVEERFSDSYRLLIRW
ncbi:hypothetical protein MYSTI_06649 [Myxococcus stipitatus DSM 14675]|uniref:DUF2378 family protein n=1 Tax=Myxococcus stipitatus (strain DSM 14675 / JCM 12634 / Mx s8) TaxID=1278073 RepID=L7UK93_MYXSD|nr:DUF2378 family protein [Myxococcus stipitatus]AGC47922.1 hypothetical protein MYSTI_06649 [Myxococcus stipitatus DSM 14675]